MSIMLLASVAGAYIYVAIDYWLDGRAGIALAFIAYAIANIGFMLDIWGSKP
jgi:hypothetical protein